jgi:hypothetical protein
MAKPLHKKGVSLFDEIAELVDGTCATRENAFQAGQPIPAPSTQNTSALALISYEPVIDSELLEMSHKGGRTLDRELKSDSPQDTAINTQKSSFYKHEIESLQSTVSNLSYYIYVDVLTSTRMMKAQLYKQVKASWLISELQAPQILEMKGTKYIKSQQVKE